MMRSLLLIFFILCLPFLVIAQTTDTTAHNPGMPKAAATKRAAQQLKRLEKQLHLTADQVLQLQVILINRDIAMDSVHQNSTGDRKNDGRARRQIQQDADAKINALLTDEQKPLYQQWKEQQRAKNQARQAAKNGNPHPVTP